MKAEELPDLYTCDLIDTGETIIRGEKIPEGRYILAAYILIFTRSGKLSMRARSKKII